MTDFDPHAWLAANGVTRRQTNRPATQLEQNVMLAPIPSSGYQDDIAGNAMGFAQSAARGALANFDDEIIGGIGNVFDPDFQRRYRAFHEDYARQHPGWDTAGQIGGGVGSMFVPVGWVGRGARAAEMARGALEAAEGVNAATHAAQGANAVAHAAGGANAASLGAHAVNAVADAATQGSRFSRMAGNLARGAGMGAAYGSLARVGDVNTDWSPEGINERLHAVTLPGMRDGQFDMGTVAGDALWGAGTGMAMGGAMAMLQRYGERALAAQAEEAAQRLSGAFSRANTGGQEQINELTRTFNENPTAFGSIMKSQFGVDIPNNLLTSDQRTRNTWWAAVQDLLRSPEAHRHAVSAMTNVTKQMPDAMRSVIHGPVNDPANASAVANSPRGFAQAAQNVGDDLKALQQRERGRRNAAWDDYEGRFGHSRLNWSAADVESAGMNALRSDVEHALLRDPVEAAQERNLLRQNLIKGGMTPDQSNIEVERRLPITGGFADTSGAPFWTSTSPALQEMGTREYPQTRSLHSTLVEMSDRFPGNLAAENGGRDYTSAGSLREVLALRRQASNAWDAAAPGSADRRGAALFLSHIDKWLEKNQAHIRTGTFRGTAERPASVYGREAAVDAFKAANAASRSYHELFSDFPEITDILQNGADPRPAIGRFFGEGGQLKLPNSASTLFNVLRDRYGSSSPQWQNVQASFLEKLMEPIDASLGQHGASPNWSAMNTVSERLKTIMTQRPEVINALFPEAWQRARLNAMRDALEYLSTPKAGPLNKSNTSNGMMPVVEQLLGMIPGVGPAVAQATRNAATTGRLISGANDAADVLGRDSWWKNVRAFGRGALENNPLTTTAEGFADMLGAVRGPKPARGQFSARRLLTSPLAPAHGVLDAVGKGTRSMMGERRYSLEPDFSPNGWIASTAGGPAAQLEARMVGGAANSEEERQRRRQMIEEYLASKGYPGAYYGY